MNRICLKEILAILLMVLCAVVVKSRSNQPEIKSNGYSWVVRIERNGKFVCGGILMGRQKILTVPGCINKKKLREYRLVFGYENSDVARNGIKRAEESKNGGLIFITPKGKVDIPEDGINRLPRIANEAKDEKVAGKPCVLTGFDDSGKPDVQTVYVVTASKCSFNGRKGKKNKLCVQVEDSSASCAAKKGSAIQCFVNRRWTLFGLFDKKSCRGKYQSATSISTYKRAIERANMREECFEERKLDCEKEEIVCPDMKTCAKLCDGVPTCEGSIDEIYCGPTCPPNELICPDKLKCASPCNGTSECSGGEDEQRCDIDACSLNPCPKGQTCNVYGNSYNCSTCSPGYTGIDCQTDIYNISTSQATWDEAKAACERMSMKLVIIDDQEEQDLIESRVTGFQHWIGLKCETGINCKWVDGTYLENGFINWAPGEPKDRDCVWIGYYGNKWDDDYCNIPREYICEL